MVIQRRHDRDLLRAHGRGDRKQRDRVIEKGLRTRAAVGQTLAPGLHRAGPCTEG
ncbi:hypothetical protein ACE1SV_74870 [Streptomyces sennicomposti]